ncbi:MAG TPA: 1-acyl-sn-glycerol-3-phosphate acyltransferase, partial [Chloroflexota bacterium]|nr:1-acyl-sn-glycerol-3-phosphate acyltransferase [Chloroflexota bacterium]
LGIPVATGYTVGDSGPIIACGAPGERRPGSIGRVLPGQEVRIADDGEILVRPARDAHKVWRDAVMPDPTSGVDWYHTGDLGEWARDTLIVRGSKRPEVDLPLLSPAMTNSHDPARVTESQGVADTLPRRVASGSLVATRAIDAAPNPDGSPFDVEAGDCADRRRAPGVGGASRTENPPPSWPRQLPARLARAVLQATVIPAIVHSGYTLRVAGLEILDSLAGPVIFAANHHWHLDTGFILATLPHRWRRHLAIAAAADDIFGSPLNSLLAGLIGNGFPVARDRAIRANLDHIGRLLDDGWSILIYPEGRLTPGGPPQSFKAGTGLVAVESGTTVVPVYVDVCRPGWREGAWQRGLATVRIGSPVHFKRGTDHQAATHQIEDAVCRLASLPVESELALR